MDRATVTAAATMERQQLLRLPVQVWFVADMNPDKPSGDFGLPAL